MKLLLRWLGLGVVALAAVVLLLVVWARFSDGPLAMLPGGTLESGDWVEGPVADWSFASEVGEIELQLASQTTSRTTWIAALGGRAFVPCSLDFPPGKTWHEEALRDGRAVLRIEGKRYRVTLRKEDDPATVEAVTAIVGTKYGGSPGGPGSAWLFRIDPAS